MKIKTILFIALYLFLTACAGTGTKTIPTVSTDKGGATNLYFVRSGGFVASGVLAKVEVNGIEVGRLGVRNMQTIESLIILKLKFQERV